MSGIETACSSSPAAPVANWRHVTVHNAHHTYTSEVVQGESVPSSPPVAPRRLPPLVVPQPTSLSITASRSVPRATLHASPFEHTRVHEPFPKPHVTVEPF